MAVPIIITLACLSATGLIVSLLIRFLLLVVTINGLSMEPTLKPGERVVALRRWSIIPVKKGNIVLLRTSGLKENSVRNTASSSYIKRVVGIEGETVAEAELRNEENKHFQRSWFIPPGSVFVCGDNRAGSQDSRQWGPVPMQQVQAIVIMKLPRRVPVIVPSSPLPASLPSVVRSANIGPTRNEDAPAFTAQTLDGQPVTLATYRDQTVVFVFFLPADPCRNALVLATLLAPKAARVGINIVAVSTAEREPTCSFIEEMQLRLPILLAPRTRNSFLHDYQILIQPAYCVLNASSKIESAGILNMQDETWKTLVEAWNQ